MSCWSTTSPTSSCWPGEALRDAGHRVTAVKDGAEALELVKARAFDLMICDIRLPKLDGLTLFRQTRQQSPDTTVILMTAFAAVQDAVAALKEGAHDYLTKPFEIDEITLRVKRIAEHRALLRELEIARAELAKDGISEVDRRALRADAAAARPRRTPSRPSHAPVLMQGESGTGKELVARALHERGARRGKAFVAVNCAAFPETLLEAELFGHERGAFTGAVKKRDGRFRAAARRHAAARRGGRDAAAGAGQAAARAAGGRHRAARHQRLGAGRRARHLGDQPQPQGARRRRACSARTSTTGSTSSTSTSRRCASARATCRCWCSSSCKKLGKPGARAPRLSPAAWTALSQYAFPGNVRELEHAIQHAVVLAGGRRHRRPAPAARHRARGRHRRSAGSPVPRPLGAALKEFEREYLLRALAEADGKRTLAAEILGISRKNLWEKLRMHGFSDSGTGAVSAPLARLFGGGGQAGCSVGLRRASFNPFGRNDQSGRLGAGRPNNRPARCLQSAAPLHVEVLRE